MTIPAFGQCGRQDLEAGVENGNVRLIVPVAFVAQRFLACRVGVRPGLSLVDSTDQGQAENLADFADETIDFHAHFDVTKQSYNFV